VCKAKPQFPFDETVEQLIAEGIFDGTRFCPHREVNLALIRALLLGPGAELTSREAERTRLAELEKALTHIDRFFRTFGRDRTDLRSLREEGPYFAHIADVAWAESYISDALQYLKTEYAQAEKNRKAPPSGGRRGNQELQGIAGSMAQAWERLTGQLPGKNNVNFHDLLLAAATTVLGPLNVDWEWYTRAGVRLAKGWGEKSGQKNRDYPPDS
jgi:hypothetical protein